MFLPTVISASQPLSRKSWFIRVAVPSYWVTGPKSMLFIVPASQKGN